MRILLLFTVTVLLIGCATQPPQVISRIPPGNITLAEMQVNPESFVGSEVRWGGVISQVENKAAETWIEVIGRQLTKDGSPDAGSHSEGRFIVSLPGFADPAVYKAGYLLTVVGRISQLVKRNIGEYEYTFPVLTVSGSYLWKVEEEEMYRSYPPPWWYYDPWPYWPYYYRPYPLHPRYH